MRFLKRLFCGHDNVSFDRNIYGDLINLSGGKRSFWICDDCGATVCNNNLFVELEKRR